MTKISQLFETVLEQGAGESELSDTKVMMRRQKKLQPRRPQPSLVLVESSKRMRQLHTMSGYFNDWAKWLTNQETSCNLSNSRQATLGQKRRENFNICSIKTCLTLLGEKIALIFLFFQNFFDTVMTKCASVMAFQS